MRKIAFVSPHCLVDFTNGAATATRDGLKLLAAQGFQCMAFCGTRLDEPGEGLIQEQLFRRKINYEVRKVRIGQHDARLIFIVEGNAPLARASGLDRSREVPLADASGCDGGAVAITLFENGSTRGGWFGPQEVNAFLAGCEMFLRKNRPDIVVTYGGDPVSVAVQQLAKRQGAIVVFWLHNFSYGDRRAFEAVDQVIVPSEFSRRYYRERLGLECHVLPNIVHWEEAEVKGGEQGAGSKGPQARSTGQESLAMPPAPRSTPPALYVTFINPQEIKGVYVFARIARELARRRPDIPILVTQGRSRGDALKNPALGLAEHIRGQFPGQAQIPFARASGLCSALAHASGCDGEGACRNITIMPFTPDPRDFYPAVFANTKLLLMPSLWFESFGLVAAEAMLNGIPVLASTRGALPETIGGADGTRSGPATLADGIGTVPATLASPNPNPLPEGEGTGGFLFDIPARYTPETRDVPTAEEVAPWVETIIRLWDDAEYYEKCSRAARERAHRWHPDRLAPLYREFFSRVIRLPELPPVPCSAAG